MLVVGIVACQGVRSSGSARAWCVRAPALRASAWSSASSPHLLGSYLGCGELLLEGFQSTFDPTRLDPARHLVAAPRARRAEPQAPRARPRGAVRLVRTEVHPGSAERAPRHARSRSSSCEKRLGGQPRRAWPSPRSSGSPARARAAARSSRCAASMRQARGRLVGRCAPARRRAPARAGAAASLGKPQRDRGEAHELVALGRRGHAAQHSRAAPRRPASRPSVAADVRRVEHERDAEREHAARAGRACGRPPRGRLAATSAGSEPAAAAPRRARAGPRRLARARGRAARPRCRPCRRRRAARRCARACAARAAAAGQRRSHRGHDVVVAGLRRARSRRCSPRRRSPPPPSRSPCARGAGRRASSPCARAGSRAS